MHYILSLTFFLRYFSIFYYFEFYQNLQRQVKLLSLSLDNAPIFCIFLIRYKFLGISSSSTSLSVSGSFPFTLLSLCRSYSPPLSLLHFLSYRLSSISLYFFLCLSLAHTHTHTHSLYLFYSRAHINTHSHTQFLSFSLGADLGSQAVFASGGQTLSEWDLEIFQVAFGLPLGMTNK